ncbi:uncharacterized protein CCOS01_04099 [Colletotrichum costaricense]|uniref:Uncharacterized protein n=1 Tax=Colletotrichum costaricense TaxID=1209916 RepID=A0AAJ0E450_9PEZI|nr:uncharacterized protein CCOS01_04099 [Colletotrichum costaricense]KAK1532116.1 hypothetical protein CCOS01_04099 [Colletotrichum costaricense]
MAQSPKPPLPEGRRSDDVSFAIFDATLCPGCKLGIPPNGSVEGQLGVPLWCHASSLTLAHLARLSRVPSLADEKSRDPPNLFFDSYLALERISISHIFITVLMAPTRDPVPAKGRGRFARLRRPSVSIPDNTPLERLDLSNANVSEISLAPMDRSVNDSGSDLSVSPAGDWRNKHGAAKPALKFKPPMLRTRPSRPELSRPWRRSTENLYTTADETNDSDVESKYSFVSGSSLTTATSVDDSDSHSSKSDSYTQAIRTRPFTTEKQVVRTSTIPPAPAKPANLKGTRVDVVAPKRQTIHIEVAPVAPAPPVVQHITSHDLIEREKVQDELNKQISRMREEAMSLVTRQTDTDRRLGHALDQISVLSAAKEKTEKQHREEKTLKDQISRDYDDQSRLLDDVRSALGEHEKRLDDVERERDQLKGIKEQLEVNAVKLEKEIEQEREAKTEITTKNAVLEKDLVDQQKLLAEQEKLTKKFEAQCHDLERSVGDAHFVTKETEKSLINRIAALEMIKNTMEIRATGLETELIRKGTEIGDITAERDLLRMEVDKYKPQVDELNRENGALIEAKKGLEARIDDLDQQKKGLEANIEKLEAEKKDAQASFDALEAEKKGLEADMEKLNTENNDIQTRFGALEVEKQEVEVRLTQLETTNTDIQIRFESLEATKGELELSKGELETQVKDLAGFKTKYDKLRTRIEGLKGKNTTLQGQVGELLKDQDDKMSQISSLAEERDILRSENESLKDENESVTSELRRAESLMGSIAGSLPGSLAPSVIGSAAPSVIGSADDSDTDTVKGEDDEAPPPPEEAPPAPPAPEEAPPAPPVEEPPAVPVIEVIEEAEVVEDAPAPVPEEVKDDTASVTSAAPSELSKAAPEPEPEVAEPEPAPAPEPEAAPVGADAVSEKAESVSAESITPSEPAVMEELRNRIAELTDRNDQLQSETVKLGSLTAERDDLVTRVARLETEAVMAPALRQENATLTSQLSLVNTQLDGMRASYDASVAEVNSLKDQIGQLRGRLSTPSVQSRSRESSHARAPSTKTKKNDDKKKEQLVVVRNPNERGGIQIIRRCDLRGMKRSSSQHSHSEGDKSD